MLRCPGKRVNPSRYEAEGRRSEAREVVWGILRVNPHCTAEAAARAVPVLDSDTARELRDGLRKAGLPE